MKRMAWPWSAAAAWLVCLGLPLVAPGAMAGLQTGLLDVNEEGLLPAFPLLDFDL